MSDLRLRAQFTKDGDLRFISHLDLTRVMERAVKRAGLPIAYSEGFHPMPKISWGPALALGITSQVELVDFLFTTPVTPEELKDKLNRTLPEDCRILKTAGVAEKAPALTAVIDRAAYRVTLQEELVPDAGKLSATIQDILEQETVEVAREKKGRRRLIDIRPYIMELSFAGPAEGWSQIDCLIQVGSTGATNPKEILSLFGFELAQPGVRVERTGLYQEDEGILKPLI